MALTSLLAVLAAQSAGDGFGKLQDLLQRLIDWCVNAGGHIIGAVIIFVVGRILISFIKKMLARLLAKRNVDPSIQSFTKSLVNILLTILLLIAVISKLGVETTSFAALLASAGVAVGMALSGNLQNFAGGLIILLLRPYKIGDLVECQGVTGTVREIQIFHTILATLDNKIIFIPNGSLSSGTIINYSREDTRRVDFIFNVEYGEDYDKVEATIRRTINADSRILKTPEPFIALNDLKDSNVSIVVRVWTKSDNYWGVYFDMNKTIYAVFNKEGINFPFPQLTVHQAKD